MGNRLVQLVIGVVVVCLLAWFMNWAMAELGAPVVFVKIAWVLFVLIVLLAVVGLLGYGPLRGPWGPGP